MKYKITLLFLIFCNHFLLFSNQGKEEIFLNHLRSTQEQLILAHGMTIDLRRVLLFILIFFGIRIVGIIVRTICYLKRIKLPVWLDMIL